MAKQTAQEKGQAKKQEDQGQRLNRQINFFVMRYMWQVICKRGTGRIYEAFGMSRERYTRIINTGNVRFSKAELGSLQQRTGLREEVFTGATRFDCSYIVEKDGKKEQHSISEDQWKELFQWRGQRTVKSTGDGKREKTIQDSVCSDLRKVERKNKENWDFYRLCYYLREKKPAPLKAADVTVRDIETQIRELTFELLDRCDVGQLKKLQKLLKEKNNMITGIIVYKDAKAASKDA